MSEIEPSSAGAGEKVAALVPDAPQQRASPSVVIAHTLERGRRNCHPRQFYEPFPGSYWGYPCLRPPLPQQLTVSSSLIAHAN